jgi:hypothetical protein
VSTHDDGRKTYVPPRADNVVVFPSEPKRPQTRRGYIRRGGIMRTFLLRSWSPILESDEVDLQRDVGFDIDKAQTKLFSFDCAVRYFRAGSEDRVGSWGRDDAGGRAGSGCRVGSGSRPVIWHLTPLSKLKVDSKPATDGPQQLDSRDRIFSVKKQSIAQIRRQHGNWSCCKNLHGGDYETESLIVSKAACIPRVCRMRRLRAPVRTVGAIQYGGRDSKRAT